MNNNWAYNPTDYLYKSSQTLIRKLVECVSKNGNMILNVGPDALGRINDSSKKILDNFHRWMSRNGEAIYGCSGDENYQNQIGDTILVMEIRFMLMYLNNL